MKSLLAPVCLMLAVWSAPPAFGAELSPSDVLAKMKRRYLELQSYQDAGTVVILAKETKGSPPRRFNTYFVRPDRFLFKWTETVDEPKTTTDGSLKIHRLIGTNRIWSNPLGVFEWYEHTLIEEKGVTRLEDLDSAVSGAQGVSLGSASTVISLLSAKKLAYGFPTIEQPHFLDARRVDRTECYRVFGTAFGEPYEVWIGKGDFLIRKVRTGKPGDVVEEVRSNVRVNQRIPEKRFHPQ